MSETFREDDGLHARDAGEGTARESGGSSVVGGTEREGAPDARPAPSALLHSLLPSLVGRFVAVRDLGSGGESDVLLVRDDAGELWVVKQYRQPGWAPDPDVLDVLADRRVGHTRWSWAQDVNARHVVWLQEWGVDPATGLFFEVQEFLEEGALAGADSARGSWSRLGQWPVEVFASAVIDAVAGFHATVGGAHRDVKPENLLVRSVDPVVLVLGDVGLSRQVGSGSVRFSKRDGSAAYQAPEAAAHGKVSRAGDWWSAGVIIAQAALGRHPLGLPDGSLPDNRVLQTEMVERPMPLAGVSDPRLRLLCEGLLTKDSERRWGLPQIAQWQAGGSPVTGFADAGPSGSPVRGSAARSRSVLFAGRDYSSPEELAAAFAARPQQAGELLFLTKDQNLLEELRLLLQAYGLHEAQSWISSYRSGAWQQAFLRLLTEMDPNLAPELGGQDMTAAGVGGVAGQVIAAGTATDLQRSSLQWVVEYDLWRLWRNLPGMAGVTQAVEVLASQDAQPALARAGLGHNRLGHSDRLSLDSEGRAVWTDGDINNIHNLGLTELLSSSLVSRFWDVGKPVVDAYRVLLCVDAAAADRALKHAVDAAPTAVRDQGWWNELAQSTNPVDRAVAAVSVGLAQQGSESMQHQLRLRREQQAREAIEEVQARERQKRDRRQAERRRDLIAERERASRRRNVTSPYSKAALIASIVAVIAFTAAVSFGSQSGDSWGEEASLYAGFFWLVFVVSLAVAIYTGWVSAARNRSDSQLLHSPYPWDDPRYVWDDKAIDWVARGRQGRG